MKEKTAWWIACGFLIGYLFAWGTIAVDRYLIIESQRQLRQELAQMRQELRLIEIVDEAEYQMRKAIEWNRLTLKEPLEEIIK